jgi:hypothetical protein
MIGITNCIYRHFKVVKELEEKASDKVIFKKNETKKMFIIKA